MVSPDHTTTPCLVDGAAHLALAELEYDILETMRTQEVAKFPSRRLIESQFQVDWDIREPLLEFLMQAQQALDLLPESFMLGISILDRYMSCRQVIGKHYQLVGCVCLWLASKAQDDKNKVPTISTLSYLCAHAYSEDMFREMEWHVLTSLEWTVQAPISFDFVDISVGDVARQLGEAYFNADDYNMCRTMARYVCECALFDKEATLGFLPSTIAASSVALSTLVQDVLGGRNWQPVFPNGTIKECFDTLVAVTSTPPAEAAARYSTQSAGNVSAYFSEFFQMMQQENTYRIASDYMVTASASLAAEEGMQTPMQNRFMQQSVGSITPVSDIGLNTPDSTAASSPSSVRFVPLSPHDPFASYSPVFTPGYRSYGGEYKAKWTAEAEPYYYGTNIYTDR